MSTGSPQDGHESTPAGAPGGVDSRPLHRLLLELGVGVLLLVILRTLVVQSFHVPSASMAPTIEPGDRVVVTKVGGGPVERGDLVVVDGTETFAGGEREGWWSGGVGASLAAAASTFSVDLGQRDYLKRVAGVGGDTVACAPEDGLSVDGTPVEEPWLAEGDTACDLPFEVSVPDGHIFLLGDNRPRSADSRDHLGDPGGGMVPVEDVIGHVAWRYWPADRIGDPGP